MSYIVRLSVPLELRLDQDSEWDARVAAMRAIAMGHVVLPLRKSKGESHSVGFPLIQDVREEETVNVDGSE